MSGPGAAVGMSGPGARLQQGGQPMMMSGPGAQMMNQGYGAPSGSVPNYQYQGAVGDDMGGYMDRAHPSLTLPVAHSL